MVPLLEIAERDDWVCHYCGHRVTPATWSRDHVVPQALFGPDDDDNLVLAHVSCNNRRGDKIDKCWCEFCQAANERWLNAGLARLAAERRTDAERAALFRAIWSKREDSKGKNYSY